MLNITLSGATGKMGKAILALCKTSKDFTVTLACDSKTTGLLQSRAEGVLIDFSTPAILNTLLSVAIDKKLPLVIGTTGYNKAQLELIEKAAKTTPILLCPNFSRGIYLLQNQAVSLAKACEKAEKITLIETHHINKKDAPSGTALTLAKAIESETAKKVAIQSVRQGEIYGIHKLIFDLNGEMIELTHTAQSRDSFALGALNAAKWLSDKPAQLYTLKDFFGELCNR